MGKNQEPMGLNKSTEWSIRDVVAKMLSPIIAGTALFFVYTGWSIPGEAIIAQGVLVGVCLVAIVTLSPGE